MGFNSAFKGLSSSLCSFLHSPVTSQTILLIINRRYQNNLPILKPICVSSSRYPWSRTAVSRQQYKLN